MVRIYTEEWNGLWKSAVESKAEVFMEEIVHWINELM